MRTPPTPYFRLDVGTIKTAHIPFLHNLMAAAKLPAQRKAASRFLGGTKLSPVTQRKRRSLGLLPVVKSFSPLKLPGMDQEADRISKRQSWFEKRKTWMGTDNRLSSVLDNDIDSLDLIDDPVDITHELWFHVPGVSGPRWIHRHKLAIRNVLAMIHRKPMVGHDLVQMLTDIQEVLTIFSMSRAAEKIDEPVTRIVTYLTTMHFDDIRNNLSLCLTLLAWSELPNLEWDAGYIECFVHAIGMMDTQTVTSSDFNRLSHVTRHNLRNAHTALQLVTKEVEGRLKSFDFSDMWTPHKLGSGPAHKAFDAFRHFLLTFYEEAYGTWPPRSSIIVGTWLDRHLIQRLQHDFGVLYDFLVDTDLQWERLKAAYRREWEIVSRDQARDFRADLQQLPVTDVIVAFDDHHGIMHIPQPYPLLPDEEKMPKPKASESSIFPSWRKPVQQEQDARQKLRVGKAYSNATNELTNTDNALLSAFQTHEEETYLPDSTLEEARLGRWLLLYGILQILSQLSVDVSDLQYTNEVPYFLCASLAGCPPWNPSYANRRADQTKSYCWTTHDRTDVARAPSYRTAASSHTDKMRSSSIKRKPLPSLPQTPEKQVIAMPSADSSISASPPVIEGMYDHSSSQLGHDRVVSNATAGSQWTDIDFESSLRPSMSTVREANAQAVPYQRGRLTDIPGPPPTNDGIKRRSSGFLEHLDEVDFDANGGEDFKSIGKAQKDSDVEERGRRR